MSALSISYLPIESLVARTRNPRTHSPRQIEQIAASIGRFGFTNPVLIDAKNRIVAGHGRVSAARLLGLTEVPTVRLDQLSDDELRAYVIADNWLAEIAGWDEELLGLEFQYLASLDIDLDLSVTGFDLPEIDVLIQSQGQAEPDSTADEIPAVEAAAVTRLGDVWQIGRHRLVCGDATDAAVYGLLLGDERAQMVFTDPPYNVPVDGHVGGLGKTRHREFAMAAGEMDPAAFTSFLTSVFRNLANHSQDGSLHFQCMDWRHMPEILAAGAAAYSELKNLCVWAKTNGGMGSLYRSRHELVFVFKSGTGSHVNNVELGRHGRYRTNVWEYPGVNAFGAGREDLALHPTVKPVALVADAILDCSRRRGIVLDAFAGSGTTLIAAERTGRLGRAIELDPLYCDVILRRLQRVSGLEARLADQGLTFDQAQAQRLTEMPEAAE